MASDSLYDHIEIRCIRLGGQVPFRYCFNVNEGLPCRLTIGCWQDHFDVEDHLHKSLSREQWDRCFNTPPKTKLETLLELIEKAEKVKKEEGK
jgi:hypothetical protein